MMLDAVPNEELPPSSGTRTIREAGLAGEAGAAARGRLAERFRLPLVALFRGRGDQPGDAEDHVQDFVTQFFLEPRPQSAQPPTYRFQLWQHQGKFDHYVHRSALNLRKDALKRKSVGISSMDVAGLESGPATAADMQFFKAVALAQWAEVVDEFRQTQVQAGKGDLFEQMLMQMSNDPDRVPYVAMAAAETARGRPTEPGNLRVACTRLKAQLQARLLELLRDEGYEDSATALAEFWALLES